ncbi:uncharacterized protein LOC141894940 [Acropora palmata]|uniref:uncharacterized protein LOC141894940 n=1 Tax=Acropora palmata TaxID=6131 RepID=UPI003DA192E3
MKRFWLCAVTILSMCSLSNCDVCRSLCSCYVNSRNAKVTDCQGRGLNTALLLNSTFPTTRQILSCSIRCRRNRCSSTGLELIEYLSFGKPEVLYLLYGSSEKKNKVVT